ncbi:hypothetical protein [Celerinatantimonas sp. YJH-8]|uniref:hypothetical protein n=1 Tax=Celerinatantimonas sp. YJH-8 TaxID=3228714 RepID=UPI0038C711FC
MHHKRVLIILCLLSLFFGWAHASVPMHLVSSSIDAGCAIVTPVDHSPESVDSESNHCALCFTFIAPIHIQNPAVYGQMLQQPISAKVYLSRTVGPLEPIPILVAATTY